MMRLHLHDWGPRDAPAIVCVHGVTGHGERFRRLAEERLAASHRIVAPDLRGHGRSGWEPPWNVETLMDDLVETVEALDGEVVAWLGFSFGGRIVAELAARHPGRVQRLVLLDPALELPASQCLESAEEERAEETYGSAEEAIEERLAAGTLISTPREFLVEEMEQHLIPAGGGRLVYRYSKSAAIAAWSEMARPAPPIAPVPTLIVVGDESFVPTAAQVERYAAALGDDLSVRSLRAGHSLLWDAFDATADAVAAFLAGYATARLRGARRRR
jgi:lipase